MACSVYMFEAELVTLVSFKSPVGTKQADDRPPAFECMYTSSVMGVLSSSEWVRREQKET